MKLNEMLNDKFYETTIRHKFKQGDRVRLKKTYADHWVDCANPNNKIEE